MVFLLELQRNVEDTGNVVTSKRPLMAYDVHIHIKNNGLVW